MPAIYKDLNVKFISSHIPTQAELSEEDCAICLDIPKIPVKTTCCNHNYCAYCGLKNVILRGSCPLCRAPINITNLAMYDNSGFNVSLERNGIKNKKEVCIKYLQDNSGENILIFSQHKNVYYNIYSEKITKLDDKQISQRMFLNNPNNVSGLKIDVQHIIFYSDFIDDTIKNKVINLIELNRRTTRPIELLFLNDTFDFDSASSLLEL
jgi:hypothetical protein